MDRNDDANELIAGANVTFPARGTWIEIRKRLNANESRLTFPARGTWIEIYEAF